MGILINFLSITIGLAISIPVSYISQQQSKIPEYPEKIRQYKATADLQHRYTYLQAQIIGQNVPLAVTTVPFLPTIARSNTTQLPVYISHAPLKSPQLPLNHPGSAQNLS
ncbi:hypothetical protein [Neptunomonas antarctica]|uniref:hypothetical protein n=1 Tax=Neptunomonas antarctica TaxID=619304 RepID=UPI0006C7D198|nr:hypothetical protein [Neptunomonas antarctica]